MQSYIPPRPFLPTRFESLNDDTLGLILKFVGDKSYATYAGINKQCREVYITSGMTKKTFLFGYGPLKAIKERYVRRGRFNQELKKRLAKGAILYNRRDVLDWILQHTYLWTEICLVAAEEGRIDLLDKVCNSLDVESVKTHVFGNGNHRYAARGKLNTLKWLETKGVSMNKERCAEEAAYRGHLNILQWLREEQGFKLYGDLYESVIIGRGSLHVLKWLREQACPWGEYSFKYAAEKGKLDILQWLHDEGCHWVGLLRKDAVKPEVGDWLRVNGYPRYR